MQCFSEMVSPVHTDRGKSFIGHRSTGLLIGALREGTATAMVMRTGVQSSSPVQPALVTTQRSPSVSVPAPAHHLSHSYSHHHHHHHQQHNQAHHHRRLLRVKRNAKFLRSSNNPLVKSDKSNLSLSNTRLPLSRWSFNADTSASGNLPVPICRPLPVSSPDSNQSVASSLLSASRTVARVTNKRDKRTALDKPNGSSPHLDTSIVDLSDEPRHRYRRRTQRSILFRRLTNSSESAEPRNERAEQRRERSRLAAQIRRNRESQSLMLLQNALPISTEVLGLHGIVAEAGNLLDLFAGEEEGEVDSELVEELMLLKALDSEAAVNRQQQQQQQQQGEKRYPSGSSASAGLSLTSNSASAVNLEKSDIIRITGNTLFLLNHVRKYLGATTKPTLTLNSQSLHGLLIDPTEMRIVYATPALAESIGWTWINLLGNSVSNVIHSNADRSPTSIYSCRFTTASSSRRKTPTKCLDEQRGGWDSSSSSSSSSSSGIGTATGSSVTTPSCSPPLSSQSSFFCSASSGSSSFSSSSSSLSTSSCSIPAAPSPLASLQPSSHLPAFLEIHRPARMDLASCRTLLAGLFDLMDPSGRQKSHQKKKKQPRKTVPTVSLKQSPQPFLNLDDRGSFGRSKNNSNTPLIFHCWHTATLQQPSESDLRPTRCDWPSDHSRPTNWPTTAPDSQDLDHNEHRDGDVSGSSSDTEAAQQSDGSPGALPSPAGNHSVGSWEPGPSLHRLQFYLLQPVPTHCRSNLMASNAPASSDTSIFSAMDHSREGRGTRRRRVGRRRTSGRPKRTSCTNMPEEIGADSTKRPVGDLDEELDPTANELLSQLSDFDLSSLSSDSAQPPLCPCASCKLHQNTENETPYRMRLDHLGQIISVGGRLDKTNDAGSSSDLIGHSFISLVHLDDLEHVLESIQMVLRYRSMAWTPIYRMSIQRQATATCPTVRTYRWVRTLLEFMDESKATLHCWHQPIGCSPESAQWSGFSAQTPSEPLLPDVDLTTKNTESLGHAVLTNDATKQLAGSSVDDSVHETAPPESGKEPVAFGPEPPISKVTRTEIPSVLTALPLQPGIRTLRIVQMPEQKRWTVEIPSTAMTIRPNPVVMQPDASTGNLTVSCTALGRQANRSRTARGTGVKRGRRGMQQLSMAYRAQPARECGHPVAVMSPQGTQLSWSEANLPPALSVLTTARRNKRKVPILMRKHACSPTPSYKERWSRLGSISTDGYGLPLSKVTPSQTPLSDLSHGSSTSACPSPLRATGAGTAWLTSGSALISTPVLSPALDESARADLERAPACFTRTTLVNGPDNPALFGELRDDHPLFVATAEVDV